MNRKDDRQRIASAQNLPATCPNPLFTALQRIKQGCLIAATGLLLSACSGGDGKQASQPESTPAPTQAQTQLQTQVQPLDSQPDMDLSSLSKEHRATLKSISGGQYYRAPEYPFMVTLPLQFITTSSGEKLAVQVSLPANEKGVPAEGPFPVILTQSAYNTSLLSTLFIGIPGNVLMGARDSFVVRRGYAQVAVDTLGTGASSGRWELLGAAEQQGMAEAVDWVKQQPWSNGKLGLAGLSYMAITSLFAAEHRPDSVDAIFASLPMGEPMRSTVGIGGQINALFMSTWMFLTHFLSTQNMPTMLTNPQHMGQLMHNTDEHVAQVGDYFIPLVNDALNGESYVTYDGEFWKVRSPITLIDRIKAPTFILGALDDLFQRDEPLLYEALRNNGVDSRLVMFDGTHAMNFILPHVGNNQVAPIDFLLIQWFDHYLRGMETGIENIPPVTQAVKNYPSRSTPDAFRDNSLITTSTWPHPQAAAERWYLRGDMSLSQTAPVVDESGPVMTQPEHPSGRAYEAGGLVYFDLRINDGTICSRSHVQWMLGIEIPKTCHYNTTNTQQQRLVFESAPMTEDYFINGPITAELWIDSTVTEAVVSVAVEEVSAGRAQPITDGQLLASARAVDTTRSRFMNGEMVQPYHYFTEEKSQPLVPGEVVKMQVEIFPTAALIRKGNRLRVAISPSNQAQSMLNYPRQDKATGGVTTLHLSPENPSSIVLPIVPTSALN